MRAINKSKLYPTEYNEKYAKYKHFANATHFSLARLIRPLIIVHDTAEDREHMILNSSTIERYHDAAHIATCLNCFLKGFVVNGGFLRELVRIWAKIIFNGETSLESVNNLYELNDLDIHLSSDYEYDYHELINIENKTKIILRSVSSLITTLNAEMPENLSAITGLTSVKYNPDIELIRLYNLNIKSCTKRINTQINIYPKNKFPDFVCNQICLDKELQDDTRSAMFEGVKLDTSEKMAYLCRIHKRILNRCIKNIFNKNYNFDGSILANIIL